uniref:Wax synthase domain-containing protein n=1 Tax=Photinus pyralis TaxID=7054 RepID=A0A1Y1MPZ9_PHOPY
MGFQEYSATAQVSCRRGEAPNSQVGISSATGRHFRLAVRFTRRVVCCRDVGRIVAGSVNDTFRLQFLRWPFTSTANYLARDLLRLARPSPVERYLNTFLLFLLSGLLHVVVDSVQGVLPSESGAMTFFPLFTLGFMIEDGIQEAWKRLCASRQTHRPDGRTTLWQRTLGFVWVITWMSLTSPPYLLAPRQSSLENRQLVPFSVVQVVGVYAGVIWILVGGFMAKVIFGGEP